MKREDISHHNNLSNRFINDEPLVKLKMNNFKFISDIEKKATSNMDVALFQQLDSISLYHLAHFCFPDYTELLNSHTDIALLFSTALTTVFSPLIESINACSENQFSVNSYEFVNQYINTNKRISVLLTSSLVEFEN